MERSTRGVRLSQNDDLNLEHDLSLDHDLRTDYATWIRPLSSSLHHLLHLCLEALQQGLMGCFKIVLKILNLTFISIPCKFEQDRSKKWYRT
jgi:hypothetical protein